MMAFDSNNKSYHFGDNFIDFHSRERIYTTSLSNIIRDYDVQNILGLYFNINVSNINNILSSIKPFNHLVSKILFKSDVNRSVYETHNLLHSFSRQTKISQTPFQDWVEYTHKNLNIQLPKICMFFTKFSLNDKSNTLIQFIKRYKIDIVHGTEIIPFSNNCNLKLPNIQIDNSVLFTKYLLNNLDTIFKSDTKYDIIIALNENILTIQPNFFILYPPSDDTLYINCRYYTFSSSKHAMYMLYQILHSNYFNNWINEQSKSKPTLVKFFIKKWFYEYIQKTFKFSSISI